MADKLFPLGDDVSFKRYKDMGDGTFAEVVSVFGQTSGGAVQIVAVNSLVTGGNSILAYGIGTTVGSYSNSSIGWCNDYMRASGMVGFDLVDSFASPGSDLSHFLTIQLPQMLASSARSAWINPGVNNFSSSGTNSDVNQFLLDYDTGLAQLSAAKDLVIVDGINVVSQSGTTSVKGRAFTFPMVNAGIARLCAKYPNVIFNDVAQACIDPASTALNPLARRLRTDDGIHQVSEGGQKMGYLCFQNLSGKVRLTSYKTVGANLLPAFTGSGGTVTSNGNVGVTGTPPVGWEVFGISGASATNLLTISAFAPNYTRLSFVNSGASAATTFIRVSGLQASMLAGKLVKAGFSFQASGLANFNRLAAAMRINGATTFYGMGPSPDEPTITYPQTAHSGLRETPPWVLPAGAITGFEYILSINVGPSGTATLDICNPTLSILT